MASSNCYCPFSFRDSVVWPSNYGFWLPLWRLQAFLVLFHLVIVLSGLHITASDYPFWHLQTFLVLFLLVIVLSGLPISASDYPFGIFKLFLSFFFWLLCCLAFKLRLLITPLASSSFSCPFSFGYCVVWPSHYGFWLPIWRFQTFLVLFLLVIVLSGLQMTASDSPFWHLQAFLVLFLLVIVLSGLQITASDYLFGVFKLFLSFFLLSGLPITLMFTRLASSSFSCPFSFGYCVVWPSNYGFWLPLWRLQAFLVLFPLVILLSGFQITASDSPFGVFKLFLFFFFWLLCCQAFKLRLLIAPFGILKCYCPFSVRDCVVWPSNYGFWLPFWRLQAFLVLFLLVIVLSGLQMTASDYPFGVFKLFLSFFIWLLCCLAFTLRFWLLLLASSNFSCPFSFGYCVVWPSNYGFWLPLWHLQTFLILFLLVIVLSDLQITASDYLFGVFKLFLSFFVRLLCCLAFTLRLLITHLASSNFSYPFSFGDCVVWPSNDGFWLPFWRLQAFLVLFLLVIVLSGLQITLLITPLASSSFSFPFSFGYWVVWPSHCGFWLPLLASSNFSCPFSFGYCVVWPSNYGFWLPLLASSNFSCPFSFGYCVVWPSNYGFWLPLWHLQTFLILFLLVIVLSGLQITASDYPFGVFKLFLSFFFWLLCCLAFKWRLLRAPFGIFKMFLSLFLLVIVLSVLLRITAFDYHL